MNACPSPRLVVAAVVALAAALSPLPAVAGDGPQRYRDPVFTSWTALRGLVYGHAQRWTGQPQDLALDLFAPDGDDEQFRPVVIWAHGGSFKTGDRTQVGPLHEFTRRGYVTASITYRLRPEMPNTGLSGVEDDPIGTIQRSEGAIRDGVHDLYAAVRWLRAHAANYRIDPARIVVAGFSAGGTMATVAPFVHQTDPGGSGNPGWSSRPAAGLSFAGGYHDPLIVHHGAPPLFTGHGTHDQRTPFAAALPHCVATQAAGNVCEVHAEQGAGHGVFGVAQAIDFTYRHVIAAERTATAFADVHATTSGETVTVAGRLLAHDGQFVPGARVLARSPAGTWTATTTDDRGRFTVVVTAPDHGPAVSVPLRYEGHEAGRHVGLGQVRVPPLYEDDQPRLGAPVVDLALGERSLAPTTAIAAAAWGAASAHR